MVWCCMEGWCNANDINLHSRIYDMALTNKKIMYCLMHDEKYDEMAGTPRCGLIKDYVLRKERFKRCL